MIAEAQAASSREHCTYNVTTIANSKRTLLISYFNIQSSIPGIAEYVVKLILVVLMAVPMTKFGV